MGVLRTLGRLLGFGRYDRHTGEPPVPAVTASGQHAVLITIVLEGQWDCQEGLSRLFDLEDDIRDAIERAGVGELDGHGVGEDRFDIFCYGRHADPLWEAVAPVLEKHPFPHGSFAIRRYGPPEIGREERVDLDRGG